MLLTHVVVVTSQAPITSRIVGVALGAGGLRHGDKVAFEIVRVRGGTPFAANEVRAEDRIRDRLRLAKRMAFRTRVVAQ